MEKKHDVVRNWILDQIKNKALNDGDLLMSELELANKFNVCRHTVRQALQPLQANNMLIRKPGIGTIINTKDNTEFNSNNKKLKTIGVITPFIDSYFFPVLINSIYDVLQQDFNISIKLTQNNSENEIQCIESFMNSNVDGLIVEGTQTARPNGTIELYSKIKNKKLPCIFFNTKQPNVDFPLISMDETIAATLVTNELINNGHKKIGAIFKSDDLQGILRYEAFIKVMKSANLNVSTNSILWYDSSNIDTIFNENNASYIIQKFHDCTGIVCYCDVVAVKILELFEQNGISVPNDISLVGFDNLEIHTSTDIQITSVKIPASTIGILVADGMIELLKNINSDVTKKITPELARYNSVKNLKSEFSSTPYVESSSTNYHLE
jgi:GntR family transcriptional regulator of arabinose operon